MGKQLFELADAGQSIWLDNIRRSMFASGELQGFIDNGLRGMTSNPTIFEKAIGSGNDYDAQLRTLIGKERDPNEFFEALAIDDIRHALDLFRPLYDRTNGGDGYVSLEVSPLLADDPGGTIEAAKRLWIAVDRPNLLVKIPATPACIPAITQALNAGINVNVTLIFSLETYEKVAEAYLVALEERVARGEAIEAIASVASVFVSRIDTAIDKKLQEKIAKGENLGHLVGKSAVAATKLVYQAYKRIFESPRFEALKAKGARVQRPLWASTGTKNAAYSDILYIEELIAKNTVNTVPPATLEAMLDHLEVTADTCERDLDGARRTLDDLAKKAQISMYDVTAQLQVEGVKAFAESYQQMLDAISKKIAQLETNTHETVSLGKAEAGAQTALAALAQGNFLQKLWKKDPSAWSAEPQHAAIIKNALGWVAVPELLHEHVADLVTFAHTVHDEFDHVVVLGMGGSSLAPDVMRETFGAKDDYPRLHVLDSSDPAQIHALDQALDIARSLFIVSSKSGTTTEPDAFFRYFYERTQKVVGASNAGNHFVAITDPDTKLHKEAQAHRFRKIFVNPPDIGGRYSALSYFGMAPAAIAGYDVARIIDRALGALHAAGSSVDPSTAPGVRFGAALGALAKAGRDKLTIVTHPRVAAFGYWVEQLIAESTGKSGTGIVPIEGETLGKAEVYGTDRVFAFVGDRLPDAPPELLNSLTALENAGHPVIRLAMNDLFDIGEQYYLWEIATAAAGSVLGIDAFDQPNVQESKDNTKRLLDQLKTSRDNVFDEPTADIVASNVAVTALSGSKERPLGDDLTSALAVIMQQVRPGDYVALNAYIPRFPEHIEALQAIRLKIRDAKRVATTVGFGPRFLHSTGQLHKGGPASGVFLQLTADPPFDLPIPGMVPFGILERAQALGDFESLDKRKRRGARIHFWGDVAAGLSALASAIDDALAAKV